MAKHDNESKSKKVYIKQTKMWVEVSEEVYKEYYRPIWRTRKRAQDRKQCACPKDLLWTCDGDCPLCEFRWFSGESPLGDEYICRNGETVSLEDVKGNGMRLMDSDASSKFDDPESALEDAALLDALRDRLRGISPELADILDLLLDGYDERSIASELGFSSQTSVNRRKKKIREVVESTLADFS